MSSHPGPRPPQVVVQVNECTACAHIFFDFPGGWALLAGCPACNGKYWTARAAEGPK